MKEMPSTFAFQKTPSSWQQQDKNNLDGEIIIIIPELKNKEIRVSNTKS